MAAKITTLDIKSVFTRYFEKDSYFQWFSMTLESIRCNLRWKNKNNTDKNNVMFHVTCTSFVLIRWHHLFICFLSHRMIYSLFLLCLLHLIIWCFSFLALFCMVRSASESFSSLFSSTSVLIPMRQWLIVVLKSDIIESGANFPTCLKMLFPPIQERHIGLAKRDARTFFNKESQLSHDCAFHKRLQFSPQIAISKFSVL